MISMLDCKQSELGTGRGNYAIFLLVSPFASLMIAKFSFVHILLNILSVYPSTWTSYINVTILQSYRGIGHAHVTSRYQAVFLLPSGLGTRLVYVGRAW